MFASELTIGYQDHGCRDAKPCHVHNIILSRLLELGFDVVRVDLGSSGIEIAKKQFPRGRFEARALDEKLIMNLRRARFDLVVSTEVIEHVYSPRQFVKGALAGLRHAGPFICSTPYHGWLKSVPIASLGKFGAHVNPLWELGHIKFLSRRRSSRLMRETDFVNLQFRGLGRIPWLGKSMLISDDKQ